MTNIQKHKKLFPLHKKLVNSVLCKLTPIMYEKNIQSKTVQKCNWFQLKTDKIKSVISN